MSEDEIRSHKGVFSRLAIGLLTYLLVSETLGFAGAYLVSKINRELLASYNFSLIFSAVIQYGMALPVFYLVIRKMPSCRPTNVRTSVKSVFGYMMVGMLFMYVGNAVSTGLMTRIEAMLGREVENSISSLLMGSDYIYAVVFVGLIGPFAEELIFRKLLIDRLSPYGNATAILFTSIIFGLFHGNLYQFFYAFALGVIFAYIYVRTGKMIYSTLLHVFINLFCGVLPAYLMSLLGEGDQSSVGYLAENMLPVMLITIYELLMLAMTVAGVVILLRSLRSIRLDKGSVRFPKGRAGDVIFFNAGTVALITVSILVVALNTFM